MTDHSWSEWIEYDGSGQPVGDGVPIEIDGFSHGIPEPAIDILWGVFSAGEKYRFDMSHPDAPLSSAKPEHDPVNRPAHYTQGGIECIDALQSALPPSEFAGFCRGNALKYLWRAGKKGHVTEDLKKARWYIERLIDHD
jgi:hypothetical protein